MWLPTTWKQLGRLTVLQIKQTRLTNILHFTAGLTDLGFLETHASPRTPAEHGKGSSTDLMSTERKVTF